MYTMPLKQATNPLGDEALRKVGRGGGRNPNESGYQALGFVLHPNLRGLGKVYIERHDFLAVYK